MTKSSLFAVFRYPSLNIDNLTSRFQNLLSKLTSHKLLFIISDVNVDLLDYASLASTSDFVNNCF